MDNLPKDNQEQGNKTSGEIFSNGEADPNNQEKSSYQETQYPPSPEPVSIEQNIPVSDAPVDNSYPQYDIPQTEGISPSESLPPVPPAFVEDRRKKYIILVAVVLILLALLFLALFVVKSIFKTKPKPSENVTITYWGLWEDKEVIQPIIDEYINSHPNISINYIKQDPKQYRERLQAAIPRGDGPDIFRFHNTWVPMLMQEMSAVPKNTYSDEELEKAFFPVSKLDLKWNGNYYGIPLTIDGLMLFYNEDILKNINISVPVTWEDVQNAVSKITVKEKGKIITSAIALGTGENVEHFSDILGLMMLQNGVQLNKSLFSCSEQSASNCSVDALTFYRQFAEPPNNGWDETLENSIVAFAGGKVAMIFAPSWQAFVIKEMSKNSNLNFKTAKVPQLPCKSQPCLTINLASYWVEGVSNRSKYQKESWEFLKYLSSESTMRKLYELQVKARILFGEPYSRVELAKTLKDNIYLAPLIEMIPTMNSVPFASRTYDGETGLNSSLITYLKDAVNSLSHGVSPESALKTADNGFKQVYSRFGINTTAQ